MNKKAYKVALIRYNNGKHEVSSFDGKLRTFKSACKEAEALNKQNGLTFGGFGEYYAPKRVK